MNERDRKMQKKENALLYGLGGVLSGVGDTRIAGIHLLASMLVKWLIMVLLIGELNFSRLRLLLVWDGVWQEPS